MNSHDDGIFLLQLLDTYAKYTHEHVYKKLPSNTLAHHFFRTLCGLYFYTVFDEGHARAICYNWPHLPRFFRCMRAFWASPISAPLRTHLNEKRKAMRDLREQAEACETWWNNAFLFPLQNKFFRLFFNPRLIYTDRARHLAPYHLFSCTEFEDSTVYRRTRYDSVDERREAASWCGNSVYARQLPLRFWNGGRAFRKVRELSTFCARFLLLRENKSHVFYNCYHYCNCDKSWECWVRDEHYEEVVASLQQPACIVTQYETVSKYCHEKEKLRTLTETDEFDVMSL